MAFFGAVLLTPNARARMRVNEWRRGVPDNDAQRLRLALLLPLVGVAFVLSGIWLAVRGQP
ncbi:MAG: hypothetical protein JWN77_2752 [Frankiales bacterium]|jgi:hypothetical protein|nr:hypothetical protein [Frankiales bacterium]